MDIMDPKKRKILLIAGIAGAVLVLASIIVCFVVFALPKPQEPADTAENGELIEDVQQEIEPKNISLIEGIPIDQNEEKVVAVIIENYIDSRRQMSGLSQASMVFEAEAEGGITRFLALYPYQDLERVGPVRSARPYFVKWAEMFDAAIVHAGGSTTALSKIYTSAKVFDLDCLALEGGLKYCVRDYIYYAPHNLFANLSDLRELIEEYGWSKPLTASFLQFGPLSSFTFDNEDNNAEIIHVYYPFPEYFVKWDYDKEKNIYLRNQAGEPHIDNGHDTQISASNVVVLFTEYYPVDAEGRLSMKVEGSGELNLFRDGKVIAGTWEKTDESAGLKFYGENGAELLFTPGKTWICVVNSMYSLQFE
ncbi:DUF3048 domain-containing protein [Candidatus Peregrinibacteria bacterium]|nr:DUF3048 domain-containing protein [Candidatus Peregrinibacteria bacterium]